MKTKREAADYLGVSVRTLERYTQKKRLPYQFEKGRRRPRVVFDDEALAEFKAQLDAENRARALQIVGPTAMRNVGFRLDTAYLDRLGTESARHNLSPGDYARMLVIRGIEEFRHDESHAVQSALLDEVSRLRGELAGSQTGQTEKGKEQASTAESVSRAQADIVRLTGEITQMRGSLAQLQTEVRRIDTTGLQGEVHMMRTELVKAVQVILLNVFEGNTEEDVRRWVDGVFAAKAGGKR